MAKDKRVEVLFDPADYKRLEEIARREGKPVGAMIREAVAKYVVGPSEAERAAAWEDLMAMAEQGLGGPMPSLEELKEEMARTQYEAIAKGLSYDDPDRESKK